MLAGELKVGDRIEYNNYNNIVVAKVTKIGYEYGRKQIYISYWDNGYDVSILSPHDEVTMKQYD